MSDPEKALERLKEAAVMYASIAEDRASSIEMKLAASNALMACVLYGRSVKRAAEEVAEAASNAEGEK